MSDVSSDLQPNGVPQPTPSEPSLGDPTRVERESTRDAGAERISSVPPTPPPVRVAELYEGALRAEQRYGDKLLRAIVQCGATHAQLVLGGARPWTRYHVDGAWRDARILPAHVAQQLSTELVMLIRIADSSCPDDRSHTFRIDIPGVGVRYFRIHDRGHVLLLSRIEAAWSMRRTEIIDRGRRLAQERLVVRGQVAMAEARNGAPRWDDAVQAFEAAVALGEGIERPAWLTRVLVQIARSHEGAGEPFKAETAYKKASGLVERRYSRHDAQRLRFFSALARCAATRGDRGVEAMWNRRARSLYDRLLDGAR
jgi:hypothetical protein